jgi:hypothetical protein
MTFTTELSRRPVLWERGAAAWYGLLVAALLGAGLCPSAAFSQADFKMILTPQLSQIQLGPGSRSILDFQLSNTDKTSPLRARVFLSDIRQGVRGQYLLSDTTTAYSCIAWMQLKDTLIEVAAGETRDIKVPIQIPGSARGGAYGAVVFELLPRAEASRAERPQASATYRFKIPAYVEISIKRTGGSLRRLKAGEIIIETAADDKELAKQYGNDYFLVASEIENTGNVLLEVRGRVIIRDGVGHLVKYVPLGAGRGAILPGAKTKLRSILKRLSPGKYTIRSIVQYGGHSPAISQTTYAVTRSSTSRVGGVDVSAPVEIDIRPEIIRLAAPVKSFRAFGLTLINREATPVAVRVALGQFYHDIDGQVWTGAATDTGRSVVRWLTYAPDSLLIEPNRPQNLRISLNVPDSAAGGYYGCVLLIAKPLDSTGAPQNAIPSELTVPIYLVVSPGLEYKGEIDDIEIERPGGRGVAIKTVFRNAGNVHTTAAGSITIQKLSEDRSVLDSMVVLSKPTYEDVGVVGIESDSVLILPSERRMLTSQTMEQMPAGKYKAIVQIAYGPKQPPVTKEKEFVVEKEVQKDEE